MQPWPSPAPNRVSPFGDILAISQRGRFLGNRGSIHRAGRAEIARPWAVRRWITCALTHKDWRAPRWEPGRWTALFFLDEAVAVAAGHRPCALCRRPAFDRWLDAWETATGARPGADGLDRILHDERVDGRAKRTHRLPWAGLPDGTFAVDGDDAVLVLGDGLLPWPSAGEDYGPPRRRPVRGMATVLTPPSSVAVLAHGYRPDLHPSAGHRFA
jgi:hypothetical protein